MPQRAIQITVDHRLRVPLNSVPDELDDALIEALRIPNLARQEAKEQHQWGWQQMPEQIVMYGLTGPHNASVLDIPRGFLPDLLAGFESAGVAVEIVDNRACPKIFKAGRKIAEWSHQGAAVQTILDVEQGIYKAPAGSGKTVTVLQAGRRAGTTCLIIVSTKDILYQWVNRIHKHLGDHIPVGIIGDEKFEVGPSWTIATAQTLDARFDKLEAEGFFDRFGFVCEDEVHHTQSITHLDIMNRFSARYRIGVSATPSKTGDFLLTQMILGPIIHTTDHKGLIERGHLVDPTIVQVKTEFKHHFRSTTSRWSKSNYPEVLNALIQDPNRNQIIVSSIMRESGHHCLVLTKRHEHIDLLEAMLLSAGYEFDTARLTGKEKTQERARVIKLLEDEPSCIFSTLADEALDVPRTDRLFLVFPQKNVELIEQQIGRVARSHPDKIDSAVIDFADLECGPMKAQWTARYTHLYKKRGFKIVRRTTRDYVA